MAVTEESRHDVYTYFDETMGRDRATTLMELLPPVGWGDVATKQFVETGFELSRREFKAEMADLRTEMADFRTELRTEMADLRTDINAKMADVQIEIGTKMADVQIEIGTKMADVQIEIGTKMADINAKMADVQTQMYKAFNKQLVAIVGANVGYLGLTLAAAKLFF